MIGMVVDNVYSIKVIPSQYSPEVV